MFTNVHKFENVIFTFSAFSYICVENVFNWKRGGILVNRWTCLPFHHSIPRSNRAGTHLVFFLRLSSACQLFKAAYNNNSIDKKSKLHTDGFESCPIAYSNLQQQLATPPYGLVAAHVFKWIICYKWIVITNTGDQNFLLDHSFSLFIITI